MVCKGSAQALHCTSAENLSNSLNGVPIIKNSGLDLT